MFVSHLGFWSGNLFLIAPFPDLCLLVPFSVDKCKTILQFRCLQKECTKNTRFRRHPANPVRASIPLSETHNNPANPVHETTTPTIFINNGGQETGIILTCLLLITKNLAYGFRLPYKVSFDTSVVVLFVLCLGV